MATTRPPFDKPMAELREAFVRARFAQEDVFGRPDIEQWLAGQREAERPEFDHAAEESYWNTVLCIDQMMWAAAHRPLTILTGFATAHRTLSDLRDPQSPPRENPFENDVLLQFIPFFSSFARDAMVYYGYVHGAIFVAPDMADQPHPYTVRAEGEKQRRRLVVESFEANPLRASLYVMDVLFAEWLYGRPRWREARQSICQALADEIKTQREVAEADFDSAVAVSADGTKIVHADWVVVSDQAMGPTLLTVYPSGAFRAQKARRPDDNRFDRAATERLIDERGAAVWTSAAGVAGIARLAWSRHRQIVPIKEPSALLLDCKLSGRTTKTVRIYITSASLCPSPLPDGGVEVTV